ncbi:MAG: NUDIX domain-containing protein [Bacteroidetes bacterium]|nr:NUDIX domain-containing protein [Bacteroidota bacterium]
MNKGKPIIIAGGGIVTNELGELLMIFRRGKWDLPKGKLDKGESIEECAIREVEEETGVQKLQLGQLLLVTEHEYFDKWVQADVIKETHWYRMFVAGVPKLVPQTEEDITAIEWTSLADIANRLNESYETIRQVLDKSGLKI